MEATERVQGTVLLGMALATAMLLLYLSWEAVSRAVVRPLLAWLEDFWNPLPVLQQPPPAAVEAAAASAAASEAAAASAAAAPSTLPTPSQRKAAKAKAKRREAAAAAQAALYGLSGPQSEPQAGPQWEQWGAEEAQAGQWGEGGGDSEEWQVAGAGGKRGRARAGTGSSEDDSQPPVLGGWGPCPCCGHCMGSPPPDTMDCARARDPHRILYHPVLGLLPAAEMSVWLQAMSVADR